MRKSVFIIILFFIGGYDPILAQNKNAVHELRRLCSVASSDTDKIVALNNLANYYNSNRITKEGYNILDSQLHIAELSMNDNLVLKTYFDNTLSNIPPWSSIDQFNKTLEFIQRGIDFAKKANRYDFVVIGYTRKASVLRKKGKSDEAVDAAVAAFNSMKDVEDSLKAIVYMELGNCYREKGESVTASTNYNSAFDIAVQIKNRNLESDIYRYLGMLYGGLDQTEAKSYLIKSYNLNKKYDNKEGLIKDYIELARLENSTDYLQQALSLEASLNLKFYRVRAKEILLAIYSYNLKDREKALAYLESEPELKDFYMNGGIENYFYELAQINLYGNKPDSALEYLKKAEPGLLKNYDVAKSLYRNMATCYENLKDHANAIKYYEISFSYYRAVKDIYWIGSVSASLTGLYKEANKLDKAFFYSQVNTNIKDTTLNQLLAKNKDLSLLSVSREKTLHEAELRQADIALTNKRNLQYMSITIAICLVFVGMLVLGMFPISRMTIRLLGYFFFISLFEFIVLVLDNNVLHSITHGEPLKLWLIKIGLIGMLVPVQHFLEHRITKFLESRQLLKARMRFSWKSLWPKRKAHKAHHRKGTETMEEDTAVL